MDTDTFWTTVDAARAEAGPDLDAQLESLRKHLGALSPDELVEFERIFDRLYWESYRADLWGAAFVLNGGCSDDAFDYFRAWLIAQGRAVYEAALVNPDSLADAADEDMNELEEFLYLPRQLYEEKTGLDDFDERVGSTPDVELVGDNAIWSTDGDMDEERGRRLYPKLMGKFWE